MARSHDKLIINRKRALFFHQTCMDGFHGHLTVLEWAGYAAKV